jgi:hypothetical protein
MAEETKEQKLMYSGKEISIIKAHFSENEELLIAIRKLFFGIDITGQEKESIKSTFSNPETVEVFRKKVYGLNNYDTPVGQLSDFWLGAETQVFGASRDTIYQAVESKKLVLDMFTKAFNLLANPDGEKVEIATFMSLSADPLQVGLIARNLYMKAIETSLLTLKSIAGQKTETLEQTVKRLQKDSAK